MNEKERAFLDLKDFAFQVIAQGAYLDDSCKTKGFVVETITLRLNRVAVREYLDSLPVNARGCYSHDDSGDREWAEYRAGYEKKRKEFERKIKMGLGLSHISGELEEEQSESFWIGESLEEVFTAVHIWEAFDKGESDV